MERITHRAFAAGTGLAAIIAISLVSITAGDSAAANAAELKVLSANGIREALGDLAGEFERTTGNKVTISYGEAGEIRKRVQDGESFDVTVLPMSVLEELLKQGKIAPGSAANVARTTFGMGVRSGGPKPDVSSADALRRSLLAVKSIVITDPATGGVSGVHFASVLERLGIAEEVRPKLKLNKGSYNAEFVAKGEADTAAQGDHEIRCVPGIDFVPYPAEFQRTVIFAAGLASSTKAAEASRAFIQVLSGPAALSVIKSKCMEPG
jgi:molybdate transport system substrate-binding protein